MSLHKQHNLHNPWNAQFRLPGPVCMSDVTPATSLPPATGRFVIFFLHFSFIRKLSSALTGILYQLYSYTAHSNPSVENCPVRHGSLLLQISTKDGETDPRSLTRYLESLILAISNHHGLPHLCSCSHRLQTGRSTSVIRFLLYRSLCLPHFPSGSILERIRH